jgi:hypothetical protein
MFRLPCAQASERLRVLDCFSPGVVSKRLTMKCNTPLCGIASTCIRHFGSRLD